MIHIIIGTKAQLIKMAPIMKELADRNIGYNFIFTGQHRETVGELIDVFKLKTPDYRLYGGRDITSIFAMVFWAGYCLMKTFKNKTQVFKGDKRGVILVHGDAFSALLGALMAKIAGIKIGYIEAGLRSFDYFHPFPEEITRVLTSRLADYHFCPGEFAFDNSQKYKGGKINTKENTLMDSLNLATKSEKEIDVDIPEEKYCLVSIHRFENIFKKSQLFLILNFLKEISKQIKTLFILHLPTKEKLIEYKLYPDLDRNPNVELRPRYDYFQFIKLLKNSEFIITDGGSNQEESYYLGKPCLIMRKTTERKEGLNRNAVVSGYDNRIINNFVSNYGKYAKNPINAIVSPSKIIVDYISKLK